MKKLKKNQGITLIALVITIIVLLILAGISISALTGSGIFEKAKQAIEKSKYAGALEKVKLAVTASYDETGNINNEYLYENLDSIDGKETLTESADGESFIIKVDGYEFIISKNSGEITKKDIEIADGEVDNSREIDEEEYNNLKSTVELQNGIIANQIDIISNLRTDFGTLSNKVSSLQEEVNALKAPMTCTKLGSSNSVSDSNYITLNDNLSKYKYVQIGCEWDGGIARSGVVLVSEFTSNNKQLVTYTSAGSFRCKYKSDNSVYIWNSFGDINYTAIYGIK